MYSLRKKPHDSSKFAPYWRKIDAKICASILCLFICKHLYSVLTAPAFVGRLTNKNEAQLSSENKNSYFEVCIVFNIMPQCWCKYAN
jgi:hypothetical protein